MAQALSSDHEWLTVPEAADYLRISRDTIYRWAKQGKLPLYKVGGTATRVSRSDLDALIQPRPHSPPSDSWTQLSAASFDADWDNPEDVIYDDWEKLYGLSEG